ncbi:MAG: transcriptional regulator [Acidimicrobiia bacterium]
MAVEIDQQITAEYAVRVGQRLRRLRRQKGLSLRDVETASAHEFKASVLGAYERGYRAISVLRLQRLARFYAVPVDELLPPDLGRDLEPWTGEDEIEVDLQAKEVGSNRPPYVMIDLVALEVVDAPEKDLLRRFLRMIQVQRQDFNGRVLTIRAEDVKVLALMLELTPAALDRRLEALDLKL